MKIIELRAENIKNLKVVQIKPEGAVILEGMNGAGKSAILDSLFMALTGKKIDKPIRNGEARAEINVDLGTYRVKRVFTAKTDRLEVVNAEGSPYTSPQALLNKLLGDLSFDPLSFAEKGKTTAGAREQRNILAAMVGLDFTEINKDRQRLYDERTVKNREIKGGDPASYKPSPNDPLPLESLVGSMPIPEEGTPRREISMADEIAKVSLLEEQQRQHEEYEETFNRLGEEKDEQEVKINYAKEKIEVLKKEIAQHEEEIKIFTATIDSINEEAAMLVEPQEITPAQVDTARHALVQIEEKNKAIRQAIEYDQKMKQLHEARKVIAEYEDKITKIDLLKQRKVNEAKFPIEGLGITDEYVTYKGKPFSQLSTGEQIRVSTAVAMALNPTLKIIVIREGSLLDSAGKKAVLDLADKKDYQVWIETVQDKKKCGIYIEDGEVK
jgi:DNA repair exonuclease SbcCD ATPase subunit